MIRTSLKSFMGLTLFVLILCGSSIARAQDSNLLILNDQQTHYPLDSHLEYLEDPPGALSIEQVAQPEVSAGFTPIQVATPNFGVTQSAYWIRLRVRNESTHFGDWRLAFTDARVGLIDLYYPSQDGASWVHSQAGRLLPSTVREYSHPRPVFPLPILPSSEVTIYLRLQGSPLRFSLSLWPADSFEQQSHNFFVVLGMVYGIIGIMAVYNLFIFFFLRKASYLYYFLFIIADMLNMACIDGTAYHYLFPNWTNKFTQLSTSVLATIFAVLFIREFLELKQRLPWLDRTLISLAALSGLLFFAVPFSVTWAVFPLGLLPVLIATLAILGALLTWRQGLHASRYFLIGWLGLLLNVIYRNLSVLAFIPSNPLYDWEYYLANVWMVTFLSLALADQINALRVQAVHAEIAMQESEKRFRHLYENAPVGIAIADPAGSIEQSNRAYQDLLGHDEAELKHLSYLKLIHPDDQASSKKYFQQLTQGELTAYEGEVQYQRKDGSPVWMMRSVSALRDDDGNILHTFAMINDISQRKKFEAELLLNSEHLEEMVAARTRELERSREQLNLLNRSSQVVNAAGLDIEQVYVAIRAASSWLLPAEVFGLFLVDQATGIWEDVFLADGDQNISGGSHPLDQTFIEEMLIYAISLRVNDFQTIPEKNWQSNWFGKYNGVRSGIAVLMHGKKDVLGMLTVQSYEPNAYRDTDQVILESFATHVSITLENIQLHQQAEKSAVLEERQRLARELHDSVTQLLYSMTLLSGGWGVKFRRGQLDDPADHFMQIEEMSLQALKEMRLLIHQLRPSALEEIGLLQALQNRLDAVEQRVNVDARLCVDGIIPTLSPIMEEEIYFIIQEALNNSLRHAFSTIIQVTVQADENQLQIAVEDNGRGYDPSQPSHGMGTTTMRDRAQAIGAQIEVNSQPNEGTKVILTMELGVKERENNDD